VYGFSRNEVQFKKHKRGSWWSRSPQWITRKEAMQNFRELLKETSGVIKIKAQMYSLNSHDHATIHQLFCTEMWTDASMIHDQATMDLLSTNHAKLLDYLRRKLDDVSLQLQTSKEHLRKVTKTAVYESLHVLPQAVVEQIVGHL
jgi:hypothetical protein